MAIKLYYLAVPTRKYTDNSGQEKSVWENIGYIFEGKDGKTFLTLKAHFNPAAIQRKEGSESIIVSLFKPKAKDSSNDNFTSSYDIAPQSFSSDGPVPF